MINILLKTNLISKKFDKIENNLSVSVSEITNIGIELILKVSTKVEIKSIKNKKKICFCSCLLSKVRIFFIIIFYSIFPSQIKVIKELSLNCNIYC